VDNKSELYMLSQGQESAFNIEACWRCEEKWLSHIETKAEKQSNNPTEPVSLTDLQKF
jgi:hypothetical protein